MRGLLFVLLFTPVAALAQVGSTTDIITGRVTGPDSQPVAGARVDVQSVETQVTRTTRTNDRGRYTVLFPDGGGQYRITVTYIGFAPTRLTVQRNADEDRLVADAPLSQNPTTLATVNVQGRQQPNPFQRADVGGTERGIPPAIANRLPVDAGDLNALAALVPGVIPVPGTDSTPISFAVAGQPPSQNAITLDGLSFGAAQIPSDAVRQTRVITNTYDVARGQFTGGQVATTTRGGTNNLSGTVTYQHRDPGLQFSGVSGPFGNEYLQNQLSFGLGGPLKKDRAFLFASGQLGRRSSGLPSLVAADAASLAEYGASRDSVQRFLALLGARGISPIGSAPTDRINDNASLLVRSDVTLNEQHSLTLRGDWRSQRQEATRIFPLAVPHVGGDQNTTGGGAMVTVSSRVGSFINELRAYGSVENREGDPYLALPSGRVTVASTVGDGSRAISTFQFGGNAGLPQRGRTTMAELSNELSWVSPEAAHRFKLGALFTWDRNRQGSFPNQFGTFSYNSLEDLANDQPASFSRSFTSRTRESAATSGALYFGDGWRVSSALQITLGARVEGSRYPVVPEYNAAVETAFGRNTSAVPSEVHVSPRVGFSYQLGRRENAPPIALVRGGFGEFRSRAPSQLVAGALDATGLPGAQSQIVCIGTAVPTPDWTAYQSDPSLIPTACVGPSTPATAGRRNVMVFDPGFEAPRAWRSSLGVSRRLRERFNVSVDAAWARGVAQTGTVDLNLAPTPRFFLASEGNRPVFADSTTIVATTGQTSIANSRRVAGFAAVNELTSRLESDTRQVTTALSGFGFRGTSFNLSYTWSRSRDQRYGFGDGGFGGGANTSGDPNRADWGRSDLDRRHQIFAQVLYPITPSLDVSLLGRATSGSPYTPMVGGDVNGDGSRNDRAFVFDPATAGDTALAGGMTRLLASTEGAARGCLTSQRGSIAARNSCSGPWSGALDAQLNWRPNAFGLARRLTLSLSMTNVLGGLDQLVNGDDDLHGWGQQVVPDRILLYVRGWDASSKRFVYQVNEHFGSSTSRGAFAQPFMLGLQGRWQIGMDDARRGIVNVLGGQNGQPLSADQLRERMRRGFANPFLRTLALNDSLQLGLDSTQKATLKAKGDTLQAKTDPLINELADAIAKQGRGGDMLSMQAALGRSLGQARELALNAAKELQATLTAEQWAKLPQAVKTPARRPGGGGPGGDGPRMIIRQP